MRFCLFFLIILISLPSYSSEVNLESAEFAAEYGLAFHTLKGVQKENNSKGQLTTEADPYVIAGFTKRMGQNFGIRVFGGVQTVRFSEPAFGTLKNEDQLLNQFGLEIINKSSPMLRSSIFIMQQDHPLYFAKGPGEFEVTKKAFIQTGMHFTISQRRRVGLLWGIGAKGFLLFPTQGGDVTTEGGVGGEAYARLGWAGPLGTLFNLKGFYQAATSPNAQINFTHETLGYCFQVTLSF